MIMMMILPTIFAQTVKVYPSEDSYVRDRQPNTNYGDRTELRVGYNINYGIDRTYLKFDLSPIHGEINSGVLSIDTVYYDDDNPTLKLYSVLGNWYEDTINWNNKPSYSGFIDSLTITNPDRIEFDISSVISGNTLSFVLIEDGEDNDYQFYSKDLNTGGGDNFFWPYLKLDIEGGCNTDADEDCNGCVNLGEIVNLMLRYKQGQTSLSLGEMVNMMLRYKQGEITC